MEQKEKKEYVEQWVSYINGLNTLLWCPDEKVAQEIRNAIKNLKDCVPKVADAKIKQTKKERKWQIKVKRTKAWKEHPIDLDKQKDAVK